MMMMSVGSKVGDIAGDISGQASGIWEKNKPAVIGGAVGVVIFIMLCCYCCIRCRRKSKKKKEAEKLKLKGAKSSKKLKRIQPNKIERRVMEELGSIKFTLQYEQTSEMLIVKILETENTPVRDLSGYAYSYIIIKVMPLHEHIDSEFKTKLVRAQFYPAFGDVFSFVIPKDEVSEQVLYISQYELNRWSKQDGIGQIVFAVKDAGLLKEKVTEVEFSKKLRPYDPLTGLEVESGAVYLALDYDSESWDLVVTIRQADIIPQDEGSEKATSYVTLTLMNKEDEILEKRKSSVKRGTLTPEYDSEVTFTIPDNLLPDVRFMLKLKSKNLFKPVKTIGKTVILPTSDYWQQLMEKEYAEGWFSVFTKPKNN